LNQRLYRLSSVTATLLLSLTVTIKLPEISVNWEESAQAQTTQDRNNEALRLNKIGLRQLALFCHSPISPINKKF
jgi:hypothetical protein